ncbi:Ohr family peroxiredoxin [Aquincola sp. MAHUQ-54]|uniref:Ohr family peroxiredoxin n=1 Tax=Aquincola agrisoli TaxID=3119538 RepID=A0AAW9Q9S6_9BURK
MPSLQPPPATLLDKYGGLAFEPLYTTTVAVSGGEADHARASGQVRSDDGALALDLRLPQALGGPGGGTNPEQLFAAGYAACFHGALCLLAAQSGIAVPEAAVHATVAFGRDPVDGRYMLTADLAVHLPGVDTRLAERLVRETERLCPYAKMARQGIAGKVAIAPQPAAGASTSVAR